MAEVVTLDLQNLSTGIPALTSAMGTVLAEAAAVCLDDRGHPIPVQLHLRKIDEPQYMLSCPAVTEAMRRTHNDLEKATENGAYGIAILLIRRLRGLTAIQQSKKGTGFDYWLGPDDGEEVLPFQNSARLEVSGILNGTASQFATRVTQKLKQTEASDDTKLTAYAIVVEFGRPQAEVGER